MSEQPPADETKDQPAEQPGDPYLRLALSVIDGHLRAHADAITAAIDNLGYIASVIAKMSDDPGVTAHLEQGLEAVNGLRESFGRVNEGLPPVAGLLDAVPRG